ncbi:MAG: hypothetical protein HY208_00200 [Nitrospirae bacterium]|nr:hypothetical protein [Nitrospirota bacterium]
MKPGFMESRPSGRRPWRGRAALPALIVILAAGWGCAGTNTDVRKDSPDWLNSVVAVQEHVEITPSMSVADRLAELRRAKEAAFGQLMTMILALQVDDHETVGALVARQPQLRQQIESYVRRVAVVDTDLRSTGPMEIHTRVEVGMEFFNLVHVKRTPAPVDRNTPSTGIVRPL